MKEKSGFEFAPTPPAGTPNLEQAACDFEKNLQEVFADQVFAEQHKEIMCETRIAGIYGTTDFGGKRSKYEKNEDGMFAMGKKDHIIAGIVDGAGGSENGQFACKVAIEQLLTNGLEKTSKDSLVKAFTAADQEIYKLTGGSSYATAIACEIASNGKARIVWAGDSKAMTVRKGEKIFEGTSYFQNVAQFYISAGRNKPESYYKHPLQHKIISGIGILHKDGIEKPQEIEFVVKTGDQIILASDGLWDIVSEYEVEQLSSRFQGERLQKELYNLAYTRANAEESFFIQHSADIRVDDVFKEAGADNITVMVLDIRLVQNKKETTQEDINNDTSSLEESS